MCFVDFQVFFWQRSWICRGFKTKALFSMRKRSTPQAEPSLSNSVKSSLIHIKQFIKDAENSLSDAIIRPPNKAPPLFPLLPTEVALFKDPNLLRHVNKLALDTHPPNIKAALEAALESPLNCLKPTNTVPLRFKVSINHIAPSFSPTNRQKPTSEQDTFDVELKSIPSPTETPSSAPSGTSSQDPPANPESPQSESPQLSPANSNIDPPHAIIVIDVSKSPKLHSKQQQFRFSSDQVLSDLRDAFYCSSDFLSFGGDQLNQLLNSPTKKTSSSYFFIENTFYNDLRSPEAIDYSKPILDWVKQDKRYLQPNLGLFQTSLMHDTKLEDLTIQLNKPYLFVHQGNCTHYIVFKEIRLFNSAVDEMDRSKYPVTTFQSKIPRYKCRMCSCLPAKFVTFNDKYSGESPCFFCDKCYEAFHYRDDGHLLYEDFKVFPYTLD